jgi:Methyltransferase domain
VMSEEPPVIREATSSDGTVARYLGEDYGRANPSWDIEDSPWKVDQVVRMMRRHQLAPASIAEIGCGAGAILAGLRGHFPDTALYGFDIAPGAAGFWSRYASARIEFTLGNFFQHSHQQYDVLLVLDVIEHLGDPFDFLSRLSGHARQHIFHIPLDLSALSVMREEPLLHVRKKVGHLHYFTKGLALAMLEEAGYQVVDSFYTGAGFTAPQRGWLTRMASLPRRIVHAMAKEVGVRLFGGETLMVLARHREVP